jgi:glycosyltransferase involved in cell wall biosynthesis
MIKVAHVIGSLEIGGAEILIKDIFLEIAKKECVCLVLLVIGSANETLITEIKNSGAKTIVLNKTNIYHPFNLYSIYKELKDYQCVHVHLYPSLYFLSIIKLLDNKKKLIFTEHNTHNKRREKWYLRPIEIFIYRQYAKIVSISSCTEINLKTWLGVNSANERYSTIPNGVNLIKYASAAPAVLDEIIDKKIILMVSRFSPQKDHFTLIKAFRAIIDMRKDVHLLLAGAGETIIDVMKLVEESSLTSYVSFLGPREDVPNLIALSNIGIQSSNWEGFGLTALEFMAAGKPIIASDVAGLSDVVRDGGLLFKKGNQIELKNHIIRLLTDQKFYNKMANKGIIKAQYYSISKMTNSYMKVYTEVISNPI